MNTTDNIEWQSSPFELEPDKFWTDDDTNELVNAATGERFTVSKLVAQRDAAVAALRHFVNYCDAREIPATTNCTEELAHIHAASKAAIAAVEGNK